MTRLADWSCEVCGSDEDPCECPPPYACDDCGEERCRCDSETCAECGSVRPANELLLCSNCRSGATYAASGDPEVVGFLRETRGLRRSAARGVRLERQKPHGGIPDAERWLR